MYSKFNTSLGSGSQSGFMYPPYYPLESAENMPKKGWRGRLRLARAKSMPSLPEIPPIGEAVLGNRTKAYASTMRIHLEKGIACVQAHALARAKLLFSKPDETSDILSVLPSKEISALIRSDLCSLMVKRPLLAFVPDPSLDHLKHVSIEIQDAFVAQVESPEGAIIPLLPPEILNSSLATRRKQGAAQSLERKMPEESLVILPSEVVPEFVTQMTDPKTHFSAAVFYIPEEREVLIGFSNHSPMQLKGRLLLNHILNLMGFCPKAFSQASKLAKILKAHLEKVNEQLPTESKIGLALTGTFVGGAYAVYAALRNRLHARVVNPVMVGAGLLRQTGGLGPGDVHRLISEVVIQSSSRDCASLVCQQMRMIGFCGANLGKQVHRVVVAADSPHHDDADIFLYHELIKNKQTEIALRTYLKHFLSLLIDLRAQGVELSRRALREFTQGKVTRAILELFERMPIGVNDTAKRELAQLIQHRHEAAFNATKEPRHAMELLGPFSEALSVLISELQEASPIAKQSTLLEALSKDCEADRCQVLKRRASTGLAERFAPRLRSYLSRGAAKKNSASD